MTRLVFQKFYMPYIHSSYDTRPNNSYLFSLYVCLHNTFPIYKIFHWYCKVGYVLDRKGF
jgi:hypothetical protein